MADNESKRPTLHGAVKPSIVIDTVLSLYSILEGLGTLLFLMENLAKDPGFDLTSLSRKHEWKTAIGGHLRQDFCTKIKSLVDLRDRCIHQDKADLKDGTDYSVTFNPSTLSPQIELLDKLLRSLSTNPNDYPETPISEFPQKMRRIEWF